MKQVAGDGGLRALRHYDAMRTKIDMWLNPNYRIIVTVYRVIT